MSRRRPESIPLFKRYVGRSGRQWFVRGDEIWVCVPGNGHGLGGDVKRFWISDIEFVDWKGPWCASWPGLYEDVEEIDLVMGVRA